jgi:hypothetical protein
MPSDFPEFHVMTGSRARLARSSTYVAVAGLVLYLISFLLPAFMNGDDPVPGIFAFLLALDTSRGSLLAWLANPILWAGLIFGARGRPGAGAAAATIALATGATGVVVWLPSTQGQYMTPAVGVYVWLTAMGLVAVGSAGHWILGLAAGSKSAEERPL